MNEQKKLIYQMALLFLVTFVFFGVIIFKEKASLFYIPKIQEKFDKYIDENYMDIKNSLKPNKISYKNNKFKIKLTSTKNKNLFFYLTYTNKKITSTYKDDYLEGKIFLKHISNLIAKEIKTKTNQKVTITINKKLNDFATSTQERILKEKDLSTLKIYTLKKEIIIDNFSSTTIDNSLKEFITLLETNTITPKSLTITITNKETLSSIEISNLQTTIIKDETFKSIIDDILNNKNSQLLTNYNIKYKNYN